MSTSVEQQSSCRASFAAAYNIRHKKYMQTLSGVARNFSGGTPSPLKGYQEQDVRGAKATWTVAKFDFIKRFIVLENEFIFQKYQHFYFPKIHFF